MGKMMRPEYRQFLHKHNFLSAARAHILKLELETITDQAYHQ
jgi:hypothetical protein